MSLKPGRTSDVSYISGTRYRLGKTMFRISGKDAKVLEILGRIRAEVPATKDPYWLLRYRPAVRWIIQKNAGPILTLVAANAEDPELAKLALWLRSRSGGSAGTQEILRMALANDRGLQVHAIRCLQRMRAWAQLRVLASRTTLSARDLRYLRQSRPREFSVRLQQYVEKVPEVVCARKPCELFSMRDPADLQRRPPKPTWLIRLVLDRICLLVSGKSSLDRMPKELQDYPPPDNASKAI